VTGTPITMAATIHTRRGHDVSQEPNHHVVIAAKPRSVSMACSSLLARWRYDFTVFSGASSIVAISLTLAPSQQCRRSAHW
jgi:hypothetical protein